MTLVLRALMLLAVAPVATAASAAVTYNFHDGSGSFEFAFDWPDYIRNNFEVPAWALSSCSNSFGTCEESQQILPNPVQDGIGFGYAPSGHTYRYFAPGALTSNGHHPGDIFFNPFATLDVSGAPVAARGVTYTFTDEYGFAFVYTRRDYLTSGIEVPVAKLTSCRNESAACEEAQQFLVFPGGAGIGFGYSPGGHTYRYFPDGAFAANGSYNEIPLAGAPTATLVVSGAAIVPEPATWGLMIAGFGMVGAALRRRVPVNAAPSPRPIPAGPRRRPADNIPRRSSAPPRRTC